MADPRETIEQVFGDALEVPPAERSAYLQRMCADAPELRREVEELLAADARAGSFLARPLLYGLPGFVAATAPTLAPPDAAAAALAAGARFRAGEEIAGRFTVVRFLARGGMGEVYEVQDRLLHGASIALKMIRPEIAADAAMVYRFEQEVLLARKIVHPNLCPMYEIFHCTEPPPAFLFLTMKLLVGQTLEACLRTPGSFTAREAGQICAELVSGVAAIHAAGVIHRDLKPNNVVLERTGTALHVVITDFGLARLHEAEFTGLPTGMVAGTRGYLAPELLRGQLPSQSTDLFALGVVLHQVLTGERPRGSRGTASLQAQPSLDRVDAPARLIAAVKRMLGDDPEARCEAFDGLCALFGVRAPAPALGGTRMSRRRFAFAAAACVCGLAGVGGWKHKQVYRALHPLPPKRFVAVLTWPPADQRLRPMLLGLVDAVTEELSRAEAFDRNFFVASEKTVTEMNTPAQMNEVRESLGANLVLATTGTTTGGEIRVGLHVLDPVSGRSLRSQELRAPLGEALLLPQRAVRAAAELLDVADFQPEDRRSELGTGNPEARAAFQAAEALRKEANDTGLQQAIEKYKEAVELDPRFAQAEAKLGWAYIRLYGIEGDAAALRVARANCEAALAMNPDLVDAHLGLAWLMHTTGDHAGADRELNRALALDPKYARTLSYQAQFYAEDGQDERAEEAYQRVIRLRPNYWQPYSDFGVLLGNLGRNAEALAEFKLASLLAPQETLPLNNSASIYLQEGRLEEAKQQCKASLRLQPNDYAYFTLAEVCRVSNRYPEAIASAQQAVKLKPAEAGDWLELGDCYAAAGRIAEAVAAFRHGVQVQEEELRNEPKNSPGYVVLALCLAKSGEVRQAGALLVGAEAMRANDITSSTLKVRLLELLGRRDEALAAILKALRRGAPVFQFQTMPDLEKLRADSRYEQIVRTVVGPAQHEAMPELNMEVL